MDSMNFIKTSDEHTADLLRKSGFPELPKEGNVWVFINTQNKVEFASDNTKMHYTNTICV